MVVAGIFDRPRARFARFVRDGRRCFVFERASGDGLGKGLHIGIISTFGQFRVKTALGFALIKRAGMGLLPKGFGWAEVVVKFEKEMRAVLDQAERRVAAQVRAAEGPNADEDGAYGNGDSGGFGNVKRQGFDFLVIDPNFIDQTAVVPADDGFGAGSGYHRAKVLGRIQNDSPRAVLDIVALAFFKEDLVIGSGGRRAE